MSLFSKLIDRHTKEKYAERSVSGVFSDAHSAVLNLKKIPLIEFHAAALGGFYREHKKNILVIISFFLCLTILISFFHVKASNAAFFPDTCLGGWKHPELAEGQPTLSAGVPLERFSSGNSAVLGNSSGSLYCGTFTGDIPKDTLPKKFVLSFSWSVDNGTVEHDEPAPITSLSADSNTVIEGTTPASSSLPMVSPLPPSATDAATTASPDTSGDSSVQTATPPTDGQSIQIAPDPVAAPSETPTPPADANNSSQSLLDIFSPRVFAQDVLPATTPDSASTAQEQSVPSSSSIDSGSTQTTIPDVFAKIAYTLDGTTWNDLGTVGMTNWREASFELPLGKWDDISHLQISITPIQTLDTEPVVYLDAMQVSVDYQEGKILQKPTVVINNEDAQVLAGDTDFSSDEAPVFAVVDPNLTNSEITNLVKEKKAEVLQDTDGVLTPDTLLPPDTSNTGTTQSPSQGDALPSGIIDGIKNLLQSVGDQLTVPQDTSISPPAIGDQPASDSSSAQIPVSSDTSNGNTVEVIDGPPPSTPPSTENTLPEPSPLPESPAVSPAPDASSGPTSFLVPSNTLFASLQKKFAPKNRMKESGVRNENAFAVFAPLVAHAADGVYAGAPVITSVKVLDDNGNPTTIKTAVQTVTVHGESRQGVKIDKPKRAFRPGKYTLEVTVETETAIIVSQQDFTWGVLAINTDKSVYTVGDTAYLQIGVLNEMGNTICNAALDLDVKSPSGVISHFTTTDSTIVTDPSCRPNNVIEVPDYNAHYVIGDESGVYTMKLTATTDNGARTINDTFDVDHPAFDVVRAGPTRIFPFVPYPMTITITPSLDWSGTVTEKIPSVFSVLHSAKGVAYDDVTTVDDVTTISWNVHLEAGKPMILGYSFKAPDISPEFYLLGELGLYDAGVDPASGVPVFQETRQWQIASDAACVASTTGNWSSSGTWTTCGGGIPTSADSVVVNTGVTVTLDVDTANAIQGITLNGTGSLVASGSVSLYTTSLTIGSSASITANNATIVLSGTSGTLFTKTGTFTAGTSTVKVVSASGNPTLLSVGTTFHILTIDSTATVINAGFAITIDDTSGAKLYVKNGVLNDSGLGYSTSGSTNNTLQIDSGGTLCLGGSSGANTTATCDSTGTTSASARSMPAFSSYVFDPASTVIYLSNAATTVSATPNYGNLTLRPTLSAARTYTLSGGSTTTLAGGLFTGKMASSSDGQHLATAGSDQHVYTSSDSGKTWVDRGSLGIVPNDIASSSNGQYLIVASGTASTYVYTSNDYGVTWTTRTGVGAGQWRAAASDSTGQYLAAAGGVVGANYVSTSNDYGATWTQHTTSGNHEWTGVCSDTTGQYLAAAATDGNIYTSNDYGLNWVTNLVLGGAGMRSVACSSDGSKLVTGNDSGASNIFTSTDYGGHWTARTGAGSSAWQHFSSSADGSRLVAAEDTATGLVYTSADSGVTWLQVNPGGTLGYYGSASSFDGSILVTSDQVTSALWVSINYGYTWFNAKPLTVLGNFDSSPTSSGTANRILTANLSSGGMSVTGSITLEGRLTGSFVGTTTLSTNTSNQVTASNLVISQTNGVNSVFTPGTSSMNFTNGTGTIISNSGTMNAATGGVTIFSGNGTGTLNSASISLYNTVIDGTGTKTLGGSLTANAAASTIVFVGTLDTSSSSNYAITSGKINIGSGTTLIANTSTITLNATSGTLFTNTGTFNQGTSTVIVASASGTPTLLSGATTFHILTINTGATMVSAGSAVTFDTTAGDALTVNGGFNDGGNQITASTGTFTIASTGTFCVGGAATATTAACNATATPTTATTMPGFSTYSFDAASTVIYAADAAQTVSSTPAYGNLKLQPPVSAAHTYTLASGALTINGTVFTIQPITGSFLLTVNMGGDITIPATGTLTITRTSTPTSTLVTRPASTDYNITTGKINIAIGGTLDCTNAASIITLLGTSGTLFTKGGTFTKGNSEVVVSISSGSGNTPTLLSVATAFHKLTINAPSANTTVVNAGFGITIDDSSGAALYVQSGVLNDSGLGISTSGSTTNTLQIDAAGTLCLGGSSGANTSANCDTNASSTTARPVPAFHTYTISTCSGGVCPTIRLMSDAVLSSANIPSAPTYGSLVFAPKLVSTGRSWTMQGALNLNGNLTIAPSSGSALLTVKMAGNITIPATGSLTLTPATATATLQTRPVSTDYNISTGTLTVGSSATLDCTSAASTITLSATSGMLFTLGGTFTAGSSTVTLSGNGDATVNSGIPTFFNLTSSGTGTKSLGAAITINNNFTISSSVFNDAGNQITGNGTGTLSMANSTTLQLGTTGTATTFPTSFTNGNISLNAGSTVIYNATVNQTISGVPTYGNLQLSAASGTPTKTLGAATTVNGSLTIDSNNTLDDGGFQMTGNITGTFSMASAAILKLGTTGTATAFPTNFTNAHTSLNAASSVIYKSTVNQTISGVPTYGNLQLSAASGTPTKTLGAATVINGSLTVDANNTLDVSGSNFSITLGGNFTQNGTLNSQSGTFTVSGSGVTLSGTLTSGSKFFDLTFSNSGTKTLGAAIEVGDALAVTGGTFDTSSSNYAVITKALSISSGKTFTANGSSITVTGDWTNSGTFTAGTSTVTFSGIVQQTLSGNMTGATSSSFYNLIITNNSGANPSGAEVTGMTPSVSFAASATATHGYTINAAHVRVQYNSGSTYTFANIAWSGTSGAGNSIYFRNSATSGTWLLVASGTQSVTYVDVSRSDASGGLLINANDGTSTDSGTNTNWNFVGGSMTFSISSNSIAFGALSALTTVSGNHTLSIATSAPNGFFLTYKGATLTHADTVHTIPAYTALSSSIAGMPGFGFNLADTAPVTNSGTCTAATNYASASQYTFVSNTTTTITNVTAPADCVFTATYKANISSITVPGAYATTITYIATGTF